MMTTKICDLLKSVIIYNIYYTFLEDFLPYFLKSNFIFFYWQILIMFYYELKTKVSIIKSVCVDFLWQRSETPVMT